jgi:hypothetical protein
MEHYIAMKNILKNLRRTKGMFLVYGGDEELFMKGYIYARFNTDLDDSKFQSGYVFILNGVAMSRRSSKQSIVAGSLAEAKYMAA